MGSNLATPDCYNRLAVGANQYTKLVVARWEEYYEGSTESHEQLFFARELGTVDEGECGGRWNELLCYP